MRQGVTVLFEIVTRYLCYKITLWSSRYHICNKLYMEIILDQNWSQAACGRKMQKRNIKTHEKPIMQN